MMAKIVHGASFIGALSYVNDKRKGAKLIAQSNGVCTVNTASIVNSMLIQARMSSRTTKPVSHLILAFSPHDASRLTEEKMARIVHDYMKRMGYDDCQYVAFIHKDRRHPHVHIIANRVNSLGMCIKDSNERYRSTKICKEMTKEYGLYYSLGKDSVNEKRLRNMDAVKYHMYHAVRESLFISRNWKEFRDDLRKSGITISFRYNKYTRGIEGISFTMDKSRISSKMRHDVSFSGKQLDNSLTFANLCYSLGYNVAVLDADIQQTIFRHRSRDLQALPPQKDGKEFEPPYEILALNTTNLDVVKAVMANLDDFDGVVLIDCPGNIVDPALEYIFQRADIAVVPTHYNADNLDATMIFIEAFKSVSDAKMVFIPNNIVIREDNRAEIAESREKAKELLEEEGILSPRIKHSVNIECYSTIFPMKNWEKNFVEHAFNPIVELING